MPFENSVRPYWSLLVLIGDLLQTRLVVLLLELQQPAGQLEPRVAVERIDCRSRRAARRLRRDRRVAVDEAVLEPIERRRIVAVEELRLRVRLQRVLQPVRQVRCSENDIVRYCETDEAKKLNCLSPSTSVKVTCVPPKTSPPLVTPTFTGGRPSRNSFSNVPFVRMFCLTSVWLSGGVKSMIGPGEPKSGAGDGVQRFLARQRVDAVLALVVGDERDLRGLLVAQHDRRDVAGQRVGELPQLARSSG